MSKTAIIRQLRSLTDEAIIFLSGGKDSIATLLLAKQFGFKLFPVMYTSVELKFQADYREFMQRRFDIKITLYPHPDYFYARQTGRYMEAEPDIKKLKFQELEMAARDESGMQWIIGGEKKMDSLQRRGMLSACQGIDHNRVRAFPLSEWSDRDVFALLKMHRLPIPSDYLLFGSSFGGMTRPDIMWSIREYFPEDFQRLVDVYPLVESSAIKHEMFLRALGRRYDKD